MVIVDICGTLFNSNTTFDFLDYFIKTGSYVRFRRFSASLPWRLLNKIMYRVFALDLTRIIAVKYLKGYSQAELQQAAEDFYAQVLQPKKYPQIWQKIEARPEPKMIASATLDFIAQTVAAKMDIQDYFATTLMYENGVCTGRISDDLLGRKLRVLMNRGVPLPFEVVFTDDFTDIPLIERSQHSVVVSKPKNIKRWQQMNYCQVEIIEV